MRHSLLVTLIIAAACPARGQDPRPDRPGRRTDEADAASRPAARDARSPAGGGAAVRSLVPGDRTLPELFALEEAERGKAPAVAALRRILEQAGGAAPGSPAEGAGAKAVALLERHYLGHEDLDLLIAGLESGARLPGAERLLRRAAESPHRRVRAAALYHLAAWTGLAANRAAALRATRELMASDPGRYRDQIAEIDRWLAASGAPDAAAAARASEEAERLLATLARDYADVRPAVVAREGPGGLALRRLGDEELARAGVPGYDARAASLQLELTRLGVGREAPEIAGRDADGRALALGDYRGRVVLLMFSANWCGPCKAMYPAIRRLVEGSRGAPVAVLGVMGDETAETVRRAQADGEITWRAWHDGMNGPIAAAWNIRAWPTTFVLDHRGVIRYRDLPEGLLAAAVGRLAAERDRDPGAPGPAALPEAQAAGEPSKVRTIDVGGERRAEAVAADRSGRFLLTGGWDETEPGPEAWKAGRARGVLQLWDAATGERAARLEGECGAIFSAAFSPDGTLVATAGRARDKAEGGEVILWDVAGGRPRARLGGHAGWALSVAFSRDGKRAASGGFDREVKVWDVAGAREERALGGLDAAVSDVAFSPDGKLLVAACRNGTVRLWETATWEERGALENPGFFLLHAAFSPDGKKLALAGEAGLNGGPRAGRVRVWDLEARAVDAVIPRAALVSSAAFSPDGRLLALADMDHKAVVYDLARGAERATVERGWAHTGEPVCFLPAARGYLLAVLQGPTPDAGPGSVALYRIAD